MLSFIDAPVLDIRDKTKKKDKNSEEPTTPSKVSDSCKSLSKSQLRGSSSSQTIGDSPPASTQSDKELGKRYLSIIESYFPELKDLSRN